MKDFQSDEREWVYIEHLNEMKSLDERVDIILGFEWLTFALGSSVCFFPSFSGIPGAYS